MGTPRLRSHVIRAFAIVCTTLAVTGQLDVSAARADETAPLQVTAVGSGFTFQGTLSNGGSPANGTYDFQFLLWTLSAGGSQVGSTFVADNINVSAGVFSVKLDFGVNAGFGTTPRWLEIQVRPDGGGAYTTLSPRQEVTPTPHALALPNVFVDETLPFVGIGRNFRISGNEVFGIRSPAAAGTYGGMYMETADAGGWPFYGYATGGAFRAWTYYDGQTGAWHLYNGGTKLSVVNTGGTTIAGSANTLVDALTISNNSGPDAIQVLSSVDDGIQMGANPDYPSYGFYIPSPGVSTYGLWPNTAAATGNYALYTVDNIEAGTVTAPGFVLQARVDGSEVLSPGDLVSAIGVGDPVPGGHTRLAKVQAASANGSGGVAGVVLSRMEWVTPPGKEEAALQPADGPAKPGDYVTLVIAGVADVRVDRGTSISAGQRLTVSELKGRARPLRTQRVGDMTVSEGTMVIGTALAASDGRETIPVLVSLK